MSPNPSSTLKRKFHEISLSPYETLKEEFERYNFKCNAHFYSFNHALQKWAIYSVNDFKTLWMNKGCTVLEENKKGELIQVEKRFVDVWVKDDEIRQYGSVQCIPPPLHVNPSVYNLWKGLTLQSTPFILETEKYHLQPMFTRILDHIMAICGDDPQSYEWMLNWIASIVQKPGTKTMHIPIIMSCEKGTGKGMFGQLMQSLFGLEYCLHTSNPGRELFGNFNTALKDKLFVSIDEINQKILDGIIEDLKSLLTEPYQNINAKHQALDESRPSFANVCLFTNRYLKWEHGCRRPVYLNSSARLKGNIEHFDQMALAMKNQRLMRMFYELLLTRDLSKMDLGRDRPITELHRSMEQQSTRMELNFLVEMGFTVAERFFDHNHNLHSTYEWSAKQMYEDYKGFFTDAKDYKCPTQTAFGREIAKMIKFEKMEGVAKIRKKAENNATYYVFNVPVFKNWLESNNFMEPMM